MEKGGKGRRCAPATRAYAQVRAGWALGRLMIGNASISTSELVSTRRMTQILALKPNTPVFRGTGKYSTARTTASFSKLECDDGDLPVAGPNPRARPSRIGTRLSSKPTNSTKNPT